MKWYEELRVTSRCDSFELIGIVFFVREIMGNRLRISRSDASDLFGRGWAFKVGKLESSGILRVDWGANEVVMRVVAPGDRRRIAQKMIMANRRRRKV